jgi:hypothetical protein
MFSKLPIEINLRIFSFLRRVQINACRINTITNNFINEEVRKQFLDEHLELLKKIPYNTCDIIHSSEYQSSLASLANQLKIPYSFDHKSYQYRSTHLQLPHRDTPQWGGKLIDRSLLTMNYSAFWDKVEGSISVDYEHHGPALEFSLYPDENQSMQSLLKSLFIYLYADNVDELIKLKKVVVDFFSHKELAQPFMILVTTTDCLEQIKNKTCDSSYRYLFNNIMTIIQHTKKEYFDIFKIIKTLNKAEHLILQSLIACKYNRFSEDVRFFRPPLNNQEPLDKQPYFESRVEY